MGSSFLVTLQVCQANIVTGVAVGVVQPFNTKLWLICPEQLNNERCTAVRLGLLEFENMIDLKVKLQIKLVKILQELAESEPKACPKHQRERWTNIS